MKKTYFLTEMGRDPVEYGTLQEARDAMVLAASDSLKSAKRRHADARKHRLGDHIRITLAPSYQSAVWSAFGVTEA